MPFTPAPIVPAKTRFLSSPTRLTDHDLGRSDVPHPWDARYPDEVHGLATCACCGCRVKHVAIVTTTEGAEFDLGLDCYARHYDPAAIKVRRRQMKASVQAREGWAAVLDPEGTTGGLAPLVARMQGRTIRFGRQILGPIDTTTWGTEDRARYGRQCDRYASMVDAIVADHRLTECDRADLVRLFTATVAHWRTLGA